MPICPWGLQGPLPRPHSPHSFNYNQPFASKYLLATYYVLGSVLSQGLAHFSENGQVAGTLGWEPRTVPATNSSLALFPTLWKLTGHSWLKDLQKQAGHCIWPILVSPGDPVTRIQIHPPPPTPHCPPTPATPRHQRDGACAESCT